MTISFTQRLTICSGVNLPVAALGVPIGPLPCMLGLLLHTGNAEAPTLYAYDADGFVRPSEKRGAPVTVAEQQAMDAYNAQRRAMNQATRDALDAAIRDMLPLTTSLIEASGRNGIDPSGVNGNFTASQRNASPIVLDLDGDGIEISQFNGGAISFDHDADGIRTGTAWAGTDDGLLVLDRDGNGVIDSGQELFGNNTVLVNGQRAADGYAALRELDTNGDGALDASDARFSELRVWRDADQDGTSDAGELLTLNQSGITHVGLSKSAATQTLADGTRLDGQGSFVIDGQTRTYTDAWFAENPFYRQFTEAIEVSDAVAALPGMRGSGAVRDMREAAMLSQPLRELLVQFQASTERESQLAKVDAILKAWADTSSFTTATDWEAMGRTVSYSFAGQDPEGTALWKQRLAVLEAFNGQNYVPLSTGTTSIWTGANRQALLQQSYTALQDSVYSALVIQTRLKPYLDSIELIIDESGVDFDTTRLTAMLDAANAADQNKAIVDLAELLRFSTDTLNAVGFGGVGKLKGWVEALPADSAIQTLLAEIDVLTGPSTAGSLRADIYFGNGSNNNFNGGDGNDVLHGGAGADNLQGDAGDDVLEGGSDNDQLSGGEGNDHYAGGSGNDNSHDYSSVSDDVYRFARGDGIDSVADYGGDDDGLELGADITTADVVVRNNGSSMVISLNTGESLTVNSMFDGNGATTRHAVESLRFADGTVWDLARLKLEAVKGTAGADAMFGSDAAETLAGGDGNDQLNGRAGNDVLKGEDGADNLQGEAGNDELQGGADNDVLQGGEGEDVYVAGAGNDNAYDYSATSDDVYRLNRGDGQDNATDYGGSDDRIELGVGITTADVLVRNNGSSLVVSLKTGESLTANSMFDGEGATTRYALESLHFADGTVWDMARLKLEAVEGTAAADAVHGTDGADTAAGGDGNDMLAGRSGDDVLMGGMGADTLYGDNGNDNLQGNEHDDRLYGHTGNDTLDGGSGNDYLSGGTGVDVYLFGKGSGQDTVYNHDGEAVGTNADTILLGAGITTTGVTLTRSSEDLLIAINGTDDSLRVQNYFNTDGASSYVVENIKFADGTTWSAATVKTKVLASTARNDTLYGYATADTLGSGDGNDIVYGYAGDDVLDGGTGADNLQGGDGNDTVKGGTGADTLYGDAGNDNLQGNEHDDRLYGHAGNDTLDGGLGNDYLSGGTGADVYLFGKGSGQDTVYNHDGEAVGTNADTILLGAGITTTGVTLTRSGEDLLIAINGTDDSLRVQSHFSTDGASSYMVENIKFADGTTWDATVKTKVLASTARNDTLYGYATADTLGGGDGNDVVYGYGGDDVLDGGTGADNLQGGDGNDTVKGGTGADHLYGDNGNDNLQGNEHDDRLYGHVGNDTLDGGSGNDYLSGGTGADVYLFGKGSGQDTVYNHDGEAVGTNADTIVLGAGITTTGVTLTRSGEDLLIALNGTDDSLRVQNYFNTDGASSYVVENVKFADGTSWSYATVKSKVVSSTPPANIPVSGTVASEALNGGLGNDSLNGQAGNDTLDGGAGNDMLDGGAGNDTYVFGKGSGKDTISSHDTTAGKLDVVQLGAGISPSGVTVKREGDNLLLSINGSSDSLRVNNYFSGDATRGYQIEQLKFADGTVWDVAAVKAKVLAGTTGNDTLYGYATADVLSGLGGDDTLNAAAGNDTLDGGAGEDRLYGQDGDDLLKGGTQDDWLDGGNGADNLQGQDGNDSLYGQAGNDTLDGGAGNDALDGGAGNDTYLFGKGSGKDTISSYDTTAAKLDIVQLGAGVSPDGVALKREGDNLLLSINGSSDSLRVNNYFSGDATRGDQVEQLKFADGTVWDVAAVKAKVLAGTTGSDTLYGYATADVLSGLGGDDTLNAAAGNDTLDGGAGEDRLYGQDGDDLLKGGTQDDWLDGGTGADNLQGQDGNDSLYGQAGNDALDGGAGNDMLDGGAGNDTYLFGKGSGKDTISSYDTTAGKLDVVQLGAGISPSGVSLRREGDNLLLSINGSSDSLRVNNYFSGDATRGYQVEQLKFADGTLWDTSTVKAKVLAGAADNDTLYGYATVDVLSGFAGDDSLQGQAGDDTLDGGAGNDSMQGGEGNDTYVGGVGNDSLNEHSTTSSDVYRLGRGDGTDDVRDHGGANDRIELGAGITAADVVVRSKGSDLLIKLNSGESLNINGMFDSNGATTNYAVESLRFADGTVWDLPRLKLEALRGTAGEDILYATEANDVMTGGEGNDTLHGRAGNDLLKGEGGADSLVGEAGDDTLDGGAGNDNLQGGEGNDTYVGGAGNDSLNEYSATSSDVYRLGRGDGVDDVRDYGGANDRIELGAGITAAEVVVRSKGSDLLIKLNSGESLNINSMFDGNGATTSYAVESLRFADGAVWDLARLKLEALKGAAGEDILYATEANDVMAGGEGNDSLHGRAGDDLLKGEGGTDGLMGEAGNDTLDGGAGNDNLQGGEGNDTYAGGAGNDSLNEYSPISSDVYRLGRGDGADDMRDYGGAGDRIELGAGVTASDVVVRSKGSDLLVRLNTGESLNINSMFDSNGATTNYAVESLRFADGTVWDLARLKLEALRGTAGDDAVYATEAKDVVAGGDGNDTLHGRAGNDLLKGEGGADSLQGEAGDDLLDGGVGNDLLRGDEGNDTYVGGAGNDSLNEYSATSSDVYRLGRGDGADDMRDYGGAGDRIELGAGVSPDQLWFRRVGSDLEVSIIGTVDRMHVNSWYSGANYRVEQLRTADGQTLLDGQVQNLVNAMASFAPPAAGQTTLPDNYRTALGSTIAANWQPQG